MPAAEGDTHHSARVLALVYVNRDTNGLLKDGSMLAPTQWALSVCFEAAWSISIAGGMPGVRRSALFQSF